jgi:hypothetical protein
MLGSQGDFMRKTGFLIGTTTLLAACGNQPGTYDVPLAEALVRLEKADLDGFRMARQCGILIHLRAGSPKDDAITWHVTSSGQEVLSFTVRLVAEGSGTRAAIDIPADPKGGEMYGGDRFYPRPAVNQPLRPAIQELIDAAMAQRPYNGHGLKNADQVCNVQRAGLESGSFTFGVNDRPGMDSRRSAQAEADQEKQAGDGFDNSYGQPMDKVGDPD